MITKETNRQCEIAMGSPYAVMEQYMFLRKWGWHHYATPDSIIRHASMNKTVRSMIWC